MAKSDITIEQARTKIDAVAQELGLLVAETSGFIKVQGPTNKHRIYVQRSRTLGRIDTTLPASDADGNPLPGTRGLSAPNGSVTCHIENSLEHLEFHLRRLADSALGVQVPNKPRPFAPTKAPARKPKAVAPPVPEEALEPVPGMPDKAALLNRLDYIKSRGRELRIQMILENHEKYGATTEAEAIAILDRKATDEDVREAAANAEAAELQETLAEAGIEVAQ